MNFYILHTDGMGRDSVVRKATRYRVDETSHTSPDRTWANPASCTKRTGSFSGVRWPRPGVDHPPHVAPRLKKRRATSLLPIYAFVVCSRVNFHLFTSHVDQNLIPQYTNKASSFSTEHKNTIMFRVVRNI